MDASKELDLLVSASADNTISLRVISTGKFVRKFVPNLLTKQKQYSKTEFNSFANSETTLLNGDAVSIVTKPESSTNIKVEPGYMLKPDNPTASVYISQDQLGGNLDRSFQPSSTASFASPQEIASKASSHSTHQERLRKNSTKSSNDFPTKDRNQSLLAQYNIIQVRLSVRGYLLIIARLKHNKSFRKDLIIVYSTNGEKINSSEAPGLINSIVFDESGYQFIVGGPNLLMRYDILSLEPHNMIGELRVISSKKKEISLSSKDVITTLTLTKQESFQKLIIGTTTGKLFAINRVQALEESKILQSLTDMVSPK
jgi:hypothetical protein